MAMTLRPTCNAPHPGLPDPMWVARGHRMPLLGGRHHAYWVFNEEVEFGGCPDVLGDKGVVLVATGFVAVELLHVLHLLLPDLTMLISQSLLHPPAASLPPLLPHHLWHRSLPVSSRKSATPIRRRGRGQLLAHEVDRLRWNGKGEQGQGW
ncbi:hypothetical protein OsI_23217 [Oryza sativa Indica Group]|uniref:Uncharacterized protein n=1 Tax=Oryza sativa subsp. indica TaxID=39946 RepID=B8B3D6_ORYSI|nr:hypothetical protein OsI_23217 [Oryza sativa Indica Group]